MNSNVEKITFSDICKKTLGVSIALLILTVLIIFRPKTYTTLNLIYYYISLGVYFLLCSYYVYICLPFVKQKEYDSVYQVSDFLFIFIVACIVFQIVFSFFYFKANVEGSSMEPTFKNNDILIVKVEDDINNFDVVVLYYDPDKNYKSSDLDKGDLLVKRVIGVPGDTFFYEDGVLFLNGESVKEEYLDSNYAGNISKNNPSLEQFKKYEGVIFDEVTKEYRISEDYYFVMGDHRDVSNDSRVLGLFHKTQIVGVGKFQLESLFKWKKVY